MLLLFLANEILAILLHCIESSLLATQQTVARSRSHVPTYSKCPFTRLRSDLIEGPRQHYSV